MSSAAITSTDSMNRPYFFRPLNINRLSLTPEGRRELLALIRHKEEEGVGKRESSESNLVRTADDA
jgi:hypothetical protein